MEESDLYKTMMITMKTTALAIIYEILMLCQSVLRSLHSYSFINFFTGLIKLIVLFRTGALERLSILFKYTLNVSTDLLSKPMLLSTAVLFLLFQGQSQDQCRESKI